MRSIESKKLIRKNIIEKRNNINIIDKERLDYEIITKFINSNEYKNANVIFSYIGFGSEIDTKVIIKDALSKGKIVYVPKVKGREMLLIKIESLENLVTSSYGILEPIGDKSDLDVNNLDIIIMPGVAFDEQKNRIGYGGGYYDRFLSNENIKAHKIALAYNLQILDNISVEEHDIKIDKIITEKRIIK